MDPKITESQSQSYESSTHRVMESQNHRVRGYAVVESQNHRIIESQSQRLRSRRITESQNHRITKSESVRREITES